MRKQLEEYLLSVVRGKKDNLCAKIIRIVLSIIEILYLVVVKLRGLFYKVGIFSSVELHSTVISVGNITTGGTGKTPFVEKLASSLAAEGKKVAVLSRGYRSSGKGPLIVSDGEEILTDVKKAGDEVYMMASHLSGIPVIRGKDRYLAGKMAVENFSPEIIIVDDSFQHWRLDRDLDIVVIDALNPFGYDHLIPRGLLREPLSALKRAGMVIITRSGHISENRLAEIKDIISSYNKDVDIYISDHSPVRIETLACTAEKELKRTEQLNKKKALALSGIGNPASFVKGLEEIGVEVVESADYPDHYSYNEEDVMDIAMQAQLSDAELVVTTDKDAVKFDQSIINNFKKMEIDLYSLGINLVFNEEVDISKKIIDIIEKKENDREKNGRK